MFVSRRRFLGQGALAISSLSLPMIVTKNVFGACDKIHMGQIGLGVRGSRTHVPTFGEQKDVEILAICDPDQLRLSACGNQVEQRFGNKPIMYTDLRNLLDNKNIDVISLATMQYWHALPTIWACQADKHVYCEKPLSHFIWEGRQMVKAARKYNRLVQVGNSS